jgi:hypothetical protein
MSGLDYLLLREMAEETHEKNKMGRVPVYLAPATVLSLLDERDRLRAALAEIELLDSEFPPSGKRPGWGTLHAIAREALEGGES